MTTTLLLVLFFACSDNREDISKSIEPAIGFDAQASIDTELINTYYEIMVEVLALSKDAEFRNLIFENVQESNLNDEDYVLEFGSMAKKISTLSKFGKSSPKINAMISKIQNLSVDDVPMIFFSKAETIEDNLEANKGYNVSKNLKEPIAILKGAYKNDYSAPGYKLENGKLVFDRMVTEEYAWNNDVYVIGKAERVSPGLRACGGPIQKASKGKCHHSGGGVGGGSSSNRNLRVNGRNEFAGFIQITDLNDVEQWFSGKLEMRVIVSGLKNGAGTVINDIPFRKVKRKHFKDNKWYDYKASLFAWNLSVLGDFNIEK